MGSLDAKYPWPSTVNFANFVTVKPWLWEPERLTNFKIWKEQMLCLLEGQGVLGFINGEIPPPVEAINTVTEEISSNVEYEKKLWRRTDRLVKGWILGSIGKDAVDVVWKLETAREVWLKLEEIFNDEASDKEAADEETSKEESSDQEATDEEASDEGAEAPDDQSSETVGDINRYLPLYKAALRGDWDTAKDLFKDEELMTAVISFKSETALHVAVSTGKANDFVNKLVELMPPDALAQKDWGGNTALHRAARVGNNEAAIALVNKNEDLLYMLNIDNRLPVKLAAVNSQKKTLEYLISCMSTKPNVQHHSSTGTRSEPWLLQPFEGESGICLFNEVTGCEFFDVALYLVEKYPHLARLKFKVRLPALSNIAHMSSVFPSGEHFCWWEKLIYHRIPLKQTKREAAQATFVASDIENASHNAPVHKKYCSSFQIISGGKYFSSIARLAEKLEFMLWNVAQNIVPEVKGIREKKVVHQQAIKFVKCLCHEMVSLPENEASAMFRDSIIMAAKHGISEIVEEILETYPKVAFSVEKDTDRDIFLLAARNRYENVFNLIYNMSDRKYEFFDCADYEDNNLMHMCGKLAPPHRLNLVPGAALQLQRELQWFKEVEKYIHPSRRTLKNSQNQTPQMLFTKEHENLKVGGERWMKDTANACTIAAALIATVVFAAIFTVPGGVASETGIPFFSDESAFVLFAISDAISLFTSITSLLMFLGILTSRYAEEDFLYVLPKRLSIGLISLFVSIIFMMVAFSATLYLVLRGKMSWFLIVVAAFVCLPVTSFVLLQFPLLVDVVYSTYGPGIFGKKSDRVLY